MAIAELDVPEGMEEDTVEFTDDVSALQKAADSLTEGTAGPRLPEPLDGPLSLPGGYRRLVPGSSPPRFETIRKVWVAELDGYAEERIAKARLRDDLDAFVSEIIANGVTKVGDAAPTAEDFRDMLAGDREALLVAISNATYGPDMDFNGYICPGCGDVFDVTITKDEIPVVTLMSDEDTFFEFKTRKGKPLNVHLPSVAERSKALEGGTPAEANSIMLSQVVDEFGGDVAEARKMSVGDRTRLLNTLGEKQPGPRYNGVKFKHDPGCGAEVSLTVSLADLFPGL